MASNLSEIIQNGLATTLESLLAKTVVLEQTTKAHPSDLKGQCVKVQTTFKFDKFTSNWSFYIPAYGANYILNLMMGEDSEPTEDLNDDTLDALNEVVSNICGGLSTTINGSGFEDLGSVQFSLEGNEIEKDASQFATLDNLFRFSLSLEEKEVLFFIVFDEPILPYIETITASETTQVEEVDNEEEEEVPEEAGSKEAEDIEEDTSEDETPDETISEDKIEEDTEGKKEDNEKDTKNEETEEVVSEEKPKESILKKLNFLKVDETLEPEEAKQAKLKKIIILVSALFGIVIITGVVLFLTGAFDPEAIEEPIDTNTTIKKEAVVKIKAKPIKKYIDFKITQINPKRLNKKLSLLTKYEILEEDAIEKIKAAQKEKLYKEKQARLNAFAMKNKEEALFQQLAGNKELIHKNKYTVPALESDTNNTMDKDNVVINSFVQIPTLKLNKFKSFIKKAKEVTANLSICKDENGRTQIFVGPFLDKKSRTNTLKSLSKKLKKDTKLLDLSQKDFDERCKF